MQAALAQPVHPRLYRSAQPANGNDVDPKDIAGFIPWILLISTIGALIAVRYAWQRRKQPGAAWLALAELTAGAWTAFDFFNYAAVAPDTEVFLKKTTWALILLAGFAFLRFAFIYTRLEQWWEKYQTAVRVLILINLLVMITNNYHYLLWAEEVQWVDLGFARVPWLEPGLAFYWLFRPTAYGLPLAGAFILVVGTAGAQTYYLRQIALLVVAALVPVTVNYLLNSPTTPNIDPTPIAVVIVIAALAWSTLRFGLLDVRPVACSLLLEQLDDGVVVLDGENRLVDLNPTAESLLGCNGWEPGIGARQIIPFWARLEDRIAATETQSIEIDLGGESKSIIEVTSTPLHDDEGISLGRVLVLHDATTQVRLVRDLDAYTETVARDLKTPLAAVIQCIDTVEAAKHEMTRESTHYLRSAGSACDRMTETIDALLSFAQLRAWDDIKLEPLDMKRIVDSALQRLSATIAKSGADVVLPDQWQAAVGHPVWVEEVWANYISNAIEYGGTPPRVEVGAWPDGRGMLRCWVRDNGPGLDENQRAQLFTEFTRLEPGRTEGHGLGLSIVRRIVEKLGGNVGCDSLPGKGSTFWFTLSERGGEPYVSRRA